MDGSWKTEDFLKKFPLGYLPAFEGADGFNLQESGAIADYCKSIRSYESEGGGTNELDKVGCDVLHFAQYAPTLSSLDALFMMRPFFSYPCLN